MENFNFNDETLLVYELWAEGSNVVFMLNTTNCPCVLSNLKKYFKQPEQIILLLKQEQITQIAPIPQEQINKLQNKEIKPYSECETEWAIENYAYKQVFYYSQKTKKWQKMAFNNQ